MNLPPGCAFRDRCRWAVDKCATDEPFLEAIGEGHWSACWRSDVLGPEAVELMLLASGGAAEDDSRNAPEPEAVSSPESQIAEDSE